jgi:hypothetical protein
VPVGEVAGFHRGQGGVERPDQRTRDLGLGLRGSAHSAQRRGELLAGPVIRVLRLDADDRGDGTHLVGGDPAGHPLPHHHDLEALRVVEQVDTELVELVEGFRGEPARPPPAGGAQQRRRPLGGSGHPAVGRVEVDRVVPVVARLHLFEHTFDVTSL